MRELIPSTRTGADCVCGCAKKNFYDKKTTVCYNSEQEKNIILNNTYPEAKFQYEGIAWYADNTPTSATTPIYRFHSQKYNAHFFTMSDTEKDHIIHTYPHHPYLSANGMDV